MIGRLTGRVVAQEVEGVIVLDAAGVGYEVLAPIGTLGRAHVDADGRATLFVHTHVRQDTLALFGFATESDRVAFRTLIGVSNVGPKTAVAVLSALPAGELARAVAAKDLRALTSISGIGKKTAERLLLELRDKLGPVADTVAGVAALPPPAHAADPRDESLRSALTNLGYRPAEADRAVAVLGERIAKEPLPELLREALAILAR
jgi:Holliday junction DNA helicase RuvA